MSSPNLLLLGLLLGRTATHATEPSTTVSGRVTDTSGTPVAAAQLEIRDWDEEGHGQPHHATTQSDANGHFALDVLPVTSRLFVRAKGYAAMFRTHDVGTGNNPGWDFSLHRAVGLSGRVVDTRGTPQPNRILELTALRSTPPPAPGVAFLGADPQDGTDAEGRFALDGISPGDYTVCVYRPSPMGGDRDMQQTPVQGRWISVAPSSTHTNLTVVVNPPEDFAVAGHVRTAQGTPVAGMLVYVYPNPHGRMWWSRTDATGAFHLEGLDGPDIPTPLAVRFGEDGGLTLPNVAMNAIDADLTIPETGTIVATVCNARTQTPKADVEISVPLVRLTDGRTEWRTPRVQVTGQPAGRFILTQVPAGNATVEVNTKDMGIQRFQVSVLAGGAATLACRLRGAAILEGKMTLDGRPYRAHAVLDGEWQYADEEGRFRFDRHPNGDATVRFFGDETWYRSSAVHLTSGQSTSVTMEMGGSCEVRGTVEFPPEIPVAHCTVRLAAKAASEGWSASERPDPEAFVFAQATVARNANTFHLRNIPPGRYHLMVGRRHSDAYRVEVTHAQAIELSDHQTLTLHLTSNHARSTP